MKRQTVTKENIGYKMQDWRDGRVEFTFSDLDDLLWYLQFDIHAEHVNSALGILPLIFRVCENKKLADKIQPVFDRIKNDVTKNEKMLFGLLDVLKENKTITEEQFTSLIEELVK